MISFRLQVGFRRHASTVVCFPSGLFCLWALAAIRTCLCRFAVGCSTHGNHALHPPPSRSPPFSLISPVFLLRFILFQPPMGRGRAAIFPATARVGFCGVVQKLARACSPAAAPCAFHLCTPYVHVGVHFTASGFLLPRLCKTHALSESEFCARARAHHCSFFYWRPRCNECALSHCVRGGGGRTGEGRRRGGRRKDATEGGRALQEEEEGRGRNREEE